MGVLSVSYSFYFLQIRLLSVFFVVAIAVFILQAPIVQRADNFIHWIGRYAANKCVQEFLYSPIICVKRRSVCLI